jgi:hypothetical protein
MEASWWVQWAPPQKAGLLGACLSAGGEGCKSTERNQATMKANGSLRGCGAVDAAPQRSSWHSLSVRRDSCCHLLHWTKGWLMAVGCHRVHRGMPSNLCDRRGSPTCVRVSCCKDALLVLCRRLLDAVDSPSSTRIACLEGLLLRNDVAASLRIDAPSKRC